jgi:hypothetical protein
MVISPARAIDGQLRKLARCRLRVGTSVTEGTANFLVNRRMNKSHMRRSRRGTDLLLQVRCAIYARFRLQTKIPARRRPTSSDRRMTPTSEAVPAVTAGGPSFPWTHFTRHNRQTAWGRDGVTESALLSWVHHLLTDYPLPHMQAAIAVPNFA